MAYELKFELPGLPKTLNARMHWAIKMKENQKWKKLVHFMTVGKRPLRPIPRAHLTLTRFSTREPDFDNLVSGFKPIVDALVECKILENDKMSNIGISDFRWEKCAPKKGKIKVEMIELSF